MGRTTKTDIRENFCAKMVNPLSREFSKTLGKELVAWEQRLPFDDVALLSNLSDILAEYYFMFSQEFSH